MSNTTRIHISHPLRHHGTSQAERIAMALLPGYFKLDERSIQDILSAAYEYAAYLQYFGDDGKPDGNWTPFWEVESLTFLAFLAAIDLQQIQKDYEDIDLRLAQALDAPRPPYGEQEVLVLYQKLMSYLRDMALRIEKQYRALKPDIPLKGLILRLIKRDHAHDPEELSGPLHALVRYHKGADDNLSYLDYCAFFAQPPQEAPCLLSGTPNADNHWGILNRDKYDQMLTDPSFTREKLRAIFLSFYEVFSIVRIQAQRLFEEELARIEQPETDEHFRPVQPHVALFLAFLRLFRHAQENLNDIPRRHLDYYYSRVLQIEPAPAQPDSAYLIFTLAKEFSQEILEKGTLLLAGKDKNKQPLYFEILEDWRVTLAEVTDVKALYFNSQEASKRTLQILPTTKEEPIPAKPWRLFADESGMPEGGVGFAIASPQLILREGKRIVDVQLIVNRLPSKEELSACRIWLSSLEKWNELTLDDSIFPSPGSPLESSSRGIGVFGIKLDAFSISISIRLILERDFDPVEAFKKSQQSPDQVAEKWPALRMHIPARWLEDNIQIDEISIYVKVDDVKENLIIQTDQGVFDGTQTVYPFGPVPKIGNLFYIGSTEIFQKALTRLTVNIQWLGVPNEAFSSYYSEYQGSTFDPMLSVGFIDKAQNTESARTASEVTLTSTFYTNSEINDIELTINVYDLNGDTFSDETFYLRYLRWSEDRHMTIQLVDNKVSLSEDLDSISLDTFTIVGKKRMHYVKLSNLISKGNFLTLSPFPGPYEIKNYSIYKITNAYIAPLATSIQPANSESITVSFELKKASVVAGEIADVKIQLDGTNWELVLNNSKLLYEATFSYSEFVSLNNFWLKGKIGDKDFSLGIYNQLLFSDFTVFINIDATAETELSSYEENTDNIVVEILDISNESPVKGALVAVNASQKSLTDASGIIQTEIRAEKDLACTITIQHRNYEKSTINVTLMETEGVINNRITIKILPLPVHYNISASIKDFLQEPIPDDVVCGIEHPGSDDIFSVEMKGWGRIAIELPPDYLDATFTFNHKTLVDTYEAVSFKLEELKNSMQEKFPNDTFLISNLNIFLKNLKRNVFNLLPGEGDEKILSTFDIILNPQSLKRDVRTQQFERYSPTLKRGFLRFQLYNTDFLHLIYPQKLADPAIAKTINPPYTPATNSIAVSYESSQRILPTDDHHDQFFHLLPYDGYKMLDIPERQVPVANTPDFPMATYPDPKGRVIHGADIINNVGNLYLGIDKLTPGEKLSLLFQFEEGNVLNLEALTPRVRWYYLRQNTWVSIPPQSVTDKTFGLTRSGLVQLALPADAEKGNTILSPDRHWIAAVVDEETEDYSVQGFAAVKSIKAQALEARFAPQPGNDFGHLAEPLPPDTITKLAFARSAIKKIEQPFPSFNGKLPEQGDAGFYRRVSERLRHKDRAVTLWDYERLLLEHFPQVALAKCITHSRYYHQSLPASELAPGFLAIAVVPDLQKRTTTLRTQPRFPKGELEEMRVRLQQKANLFLQAEPPGAETPDEKFIQVVNPQYEPLRLLIYLNFKPGDDGLYRYQLNEALRNYIAPWLDATEAGPVFGRVLYRSRIISLIESLEFVDFVKEMHVYRLAGYTYDGTTVPEEPTDPMPTNDTSTWMHYRLHTEEIAPATARSILTTVDKHRIVTVEASEGNVSPGIDSQPRFPLVVPPSAPLPPEVTESSESVSTEPSSTATVPASSEIPDKTQTANPKPTSPKEKGQKKKTQKK